MFALGVHCICYQFHSLGDNFHSPNHFLVSNGEGIFLDQIAKYWEGELASLLGHDALSDRREKLRRIRP